MANLFKTLYNGFDKKNWIQARQELLHQQFRTGSTWFSPENLENIGCDLQADLEANGKKTIPLEFVDIGELEI